MHAFDWFKISYTNNQSAVSSETSQVISYHCQQYSVCMSICIVYVYVLWVTSEGRQQFGLYPHGHFGIFILYSSSVTLLYSFMSCHVISLFKHTYWSYITIQYDTSLLLHGASYLLLHAIMSCVCQHADWLISYHITSYCRMGWDGLCFAAFLKLWRIVSFILHSILLLWN